jgi:hypothetical protein
LDPLPAAFEYAVGSILAGSRSKLEPPLAKATNIVRLLIFILVFRIVQLGAANHSRMVGYQLPWMPKVPITRIYSRGHAGAELTVRNYSLETVGSSSSSSSASATPVARQEFELLFSESWLNSLTSGTFPQQKACQFQSQWPARGFDCQNRSLFLDHQWQAGPCRIPLTLDQSVDTL